MTSQQFKSLFGNLQVSVIVCEDTEAMTVTYANASAFIMFNPSMIASHSDEQVTNFPLSTLISFHSEGIRANVYQTLNTAGILIKYRTFFMAPDGVVANVQIDANAIDWDGTRHFVLYCQVIHEDEDPHDKERSDILFSILNTTFHTADINEAIQSTMFIVGHYLDVSRIYIFEDQMNNYLRNTYEWCAQSIEPVIQNYQNRSKDDYNYYTILNPSGLYVTNDVRMLPDYDREIMQAQGIKSTVVLPLYHMDVPLGYIGYDDCENYRIWTLRELQFLQSITSIVSSLLNRRNAENQARRSHEILQTISDNTSSVIYVSDLDTYELKFVNRMLSDSMGVAPEQLIGQICWKVLQNDMEEPCPFCPLLELKDDEGRPSPDVYEWEHQNTKTGMWMWATNAIIPWIDGTLVHIETATDITYRKNYEDQLQHFASIDSLTGIFNREWGYNLFKEIHTSVRISGNIYSLCFIDLDGLKIMNDTYGHKAGDGMILEVLSVIKESTRKDDILCRWGGDEFLLLLKCSNEKAHSIIGTIQEKLCITSEKRGYNPPLAFSYGVVDFNAADSVDTLVTNADQLMYEDKTRKRKAKG